MADVERRRGERPLEIAFVMSLAMGHKTQYLNWRRVVDALPGEVSPSWIPVASGVEQAWLRRLPLPDSLQRTLGEYATIRAGLARARYDAVLMNPHNLAVKHQRLLARQPVFLSLDATRRQWAQFSRWYRPAPSEEGFVGSLRVKRQKRNLQAAAGLFPVSGWAARSLIEDYGADPKKVHVIPVGVDTQLWKPDEGQRPGDGVVRILFIGRHLQLKGGDLLLRWARETAQKNWELHLVTAAPGEPAPNVTYHQAAANSSGLVALAQRCDLFVLPTLADCYSISLIEAMSAALPGVVSSVGGIPELVVEGQTGWVIPRDDYGALHDQLDAVLARREQLPAMGRAARARALASFDSSKNVRRALDLIEAACGCGPAPAETPR